MRADAREQLAQAVRLGHVIVCAHFQPQHLVGLVALNRQHQDRLAQPQLAHLAAEIEARSVGQAHVEDDQVRVLVAGEADTLAAGRFPRDRIAAIAGQPVLQAARDGRIVLDQQNVSGHAACSYRYS